MAENTAHHTTTACEPLLEASLLEPGLCANNTCSEAGDHKHCLEEAKLYCAKCQLVQYCSKGCQSAHWKVHKADCRSPFMKATWKPSWEAESREPGFVGDGPPTIHGGNKYMWGNMPALDILNIRDNEAAHIPDELSLLFAASGDLGNVVKSIVGLNGDYKGRCRVVINDWDLDIVARNAIMLLSALHFELEVATPIIMHLWYSAFITPSILQALQIHILPLIVEVCEKIEKRPLAVQELVQAKTWRYGPSSVRLVLSKDNWFKLQEYLKVPPGLTLIDAVIARHEVTVAPCRVDYVDRVLLNQPPAWRLCTTKFRHEGLLLPFASTCHDFSVPNPTLFQKNEWPLGDGADPLQGWNILEVVAARIPLPAKRDVYGAMFFYLRQHLLEFCTRLKTCNIEMHMHLQNANRLPEVFAFGSGPKQFDRIEISNIMDEGYLGLEVSLATFAPMLKSKRENPHAVLIGLFLNQPKGAALEEIRINPRKYPAQSAVSKAAKYIRGDPFDLVTMYSSAMVRIIAAIDFFRDHEAQFEKFRRTRKMDALTAKNGLKMRRKHTIIGPWPMRLRDGASQNEFDVLCASGHIGCERYVEWELAGKPEAA